MVTNTPINAAALTEMKIGAAMTPTTVKYTSPVTFAPQSITDFVNAPAAAVSGFKNNVLGLNLPSDHITINALKFSDPNWDRVTDVAGALFAAISGGAVFDISTNLGATYQNMVATALNIPVDAQSGSSINFSMEFTQIRFATTLTVAVNARQAVIHRGHKPALPATPVQTAKLKSVLAAEWDAGNPSEPTPAQLLPPPGIPPL